MADWELSFNGLTIGPGTPYGLDNLIGFHDTPDVRSVDQPRARTHGMWLSPDFLGGRTIQASVVITSPHPSSSVWQALSQALVTGQPSETPLLATMPGVAYGRTVRVNARVRRLSLPLTMDYTFGLGRAEVEWFCTDPRIYDNNETSLTVAQATSSGGLTFNATFPLSFGGASIAGIIDATNDGEFLSPWTATISGPVVNPRIENITTGQTLTFIGTVNSGETLIVSSLDRTVLLNGTASRYSWLATTSSWFDLAAGQNQVRFAGTSGSGSMTFAYRSAWI